MKAQPINNSEFISKSPGLAQQRSLSDNQDGCEGGEEEGGGSTAPLQQTSDAHQCLVKHFGVHPSSSSPGGHLASLSRRSEESIQKTEHGHSASLIQGCHPQLRNSVNPTAWLRAARGTHTHFLPGSSGEGRAWPGAS